MLDRYGAHGREDYAYLRMERIRARHAPRGASTSTMSPSALPRSARPTGDSGETPPTLEISIVIFSPSSRSSSTVAADGDDAARRGGVLVDHLRAVQPRAQDRDPPLEQPLLVLRGVVLEVLGEVAVPPGCRDRLDHGLPLRPLQLRKLGGQLLVLRTSELLAALLIRPSVAAAAGAAAAPAAAPTAAERRRLRGTVHGERRELARDVRRRAVRAGDLLLAPHELLEVRLAFHADVLVDRHGPVYAGRGL